MYGYEPLPALRPTYLKSTVLVHIVYSLIRKARNFINMVLSYFICVPRSSQLLFLRFTVM